MDNISKPIESSKKTSNTPKGLESPVKKTDNSLKGLESLAKKSSNSPKDLESPVKKVAQPGLLSQFSDSLLYSAVQSPIDALSQLVDKTVNTHLESKLQFVKPQAPAKFNTLNWYVQEAGSSLGMLVPLMATSGLVKWAMPSELLPSLAAESLANQSAASDFLATSDMAANKMAQNIADSKFLTPTLDNAPAIKFSQETDSLTAKSLSISPLNVRSALGLSTLESAVTGAGYGFFLTPGQDNSQSYQGFIASRLDNSISQGLMFSAMTASSLGLKSLAGEPGLEKNVIGQVLNNNMANSVIASVPGSILGTETSSYFNTGKLASTDTLLQGAYTMSLVSLGFGGLNEVQSRIGDLIKAKGANSGIGQSGELYPAAARPPIYPINERFLASVFQPEANSAEFVPKARILINGLVPGDHLLDDQVQINNLQAQSMLDLNDGKLIFTNKFKEPVFIIPDRLDSKLKIIINPNRSIEISPHSDLRLGSEDGPKLEIFQSHETTIPEVFFQGRPIELKDGSANIGRRNFNSVNPDLLELLLDNEHGKISYDPTYKNFIYTDTSTNGSFIKDKNDQWFELKKGDSKIVSPTDEIHLASKDGPLLRVHLVNGYRLDSGTIIYKRQNSDVIFNKFGFSKFKDVADNGYFKDKSNRITKTFGPNNFSIEYKYDANGKLVQAYINHFDKYTRYLTLDDNGKWTSQLSKNVEPDYNLKQLNGVFQIGTDGSLIYRGRIGHRIVQNIDGSKENLYDYGYQHLVTADLTAEEANFKKILDNINFDLPARKGRFELLANNAKDNMTKNSIDKNDQAIFLHHVNRLLKASSESYLDKITRLKLAEQVLLNTAFPHTIDQGFNSTCNVATVENRVYNRAPQYAAKLIADAAITGKIITVNGKIIDLATSGGLTPDSETSAVLRQNFDPSLFRDVKIDGRRNLANQIFQSAAVNMFYAERPHEEALKMDEKLMPIVQYIKYPSDGSNPSDTGERLILNYLEDNTLKRKVLARAPKIKISDLSLIYNLLVPELGLDNSIRTGQEKNFVIIGDSRQAGPIENFTSGKLKLASNEAEFEDILKSSKTKYPLILLVNAYSDESIFGPSRAGHAAHVINIDNVYENTLTNPPTLMVEFTNQWGVQSNHLGVKAVPASQLYKTSVFPDKK